MKIDFVELGKYCQKEYKDSLEGNESNHYCRTLFVAIQNNNNVLVSITPHILSQASKCILIHERRSKAVSNWYSWYSVQFINELGEIFDSRIDNEFELSISAIGSFSNQQMSLSANHRVYYSSGGPWESCIQSFWDLYIRLKGVKSNTERELVSSLFVKDNKILELEKSLSDFSFKTRLLENEKNQYKQLLDNIKEMIESR